MGGSSTPYWDGVYAADPDFFGGSASSLARATLGRLLREAAGGRLAELGCGTGQDLTYFAAHGMTVEACDLSTVGCRRTNERLAELRDELPPRAHARVADALAFLQDHGSGCLDVVYANLYLNLEIDPDRAAALAREVARVVRPGGWWIFRVRSTRDPWYGRGTPRGEGVFDPGEGRPALRFFSEAAARRLATADFELAELGEHPDGEPAFPVVVLDAAFRRRA